MIGHHRDATYAFADLAFKNVTSRISAIKAVLPGIRLTLRAFGKNGKLAFTMAAPHLARREGDDSLYVNAPKYLFVATDGSDCTNTPSVLANATSCSNVRAFLIADSSSPTR